MEDLGTRLVRKDGRICFRARDYEVGRDWSGQIVRLDRRDGNLVATGESGELRTCIEKPPSSRPLLKCRKCKTMKFVYARGLCIQCYQEERRKIYKGRRSEFLEAYGMKAACKRCKQHFRLNREGHCHSCAVIIANTSAKARKTNTMIRSLEERITQLEVEVRNLWEVV